MNTQNKFRFAVLAIAVLIGACALPGCNTEPKLTSDETAHIAQLDQQIAPLKAQQAVLEKEAQAEMSAASTAVSEADKQAALDAVAATQAKWKAVITNMETLTKQQDDITAAALARTTAPYVAGAQAVATASGLPWLTLLLGAVAPLAIGAAGSTRTRGHLLDGLLSVVKGQGAESFITYLTKAYGWTHSEPGDKGHVDAPPLLAANLPTIAVAVPAA